MWRQPETQISNSLTRQRTTLHVHHALLYISLPSTARLPMKMPNFMFCEGHKQAVTKFILFMNFDVVDRNSAHFTKRHFRGCQPSAMVSQIVMQDVSDASVNTCCKLKLVFWKSVFSFWANQIMGIYIKPKVS